MGSLLEEEPTPAALLVPFSTNFNPWMEGARCSVVLGLST